MPGSTIDAVSSTHLRRALLLALLLLLAIPMGASAVSRLKAISYNGYRVLVPAGWPVYDLARDPRVCVRFDRHAVYLGRPGSQQACPAHAAGRTEAILLQPASAGAARAASAGGVELGVPSAGTLVHHGLLITATWGSHGGVITHALGLRSLNALRAPAPAARPAAGRPTARLASGAPATAGGIYTGPGFDVCSTPSSSQMAAWGSSSYRAIGVYIGGANMACAQPNLSAGWVSGESAEGWHIIPIYVGLQAPANSCGCAGISSANASSQGRAAALDAVSQAQSLGMGAGNPIYFDMEAYSRGGSNSSAVLAFLAAWTGQLHAQGYESGVYSSDYSGISDLVAQTGTGYPEPDEIWFANWNGVKSTSDATIPPGDWAGHQRLHQYDGGHNETHGGVTLNIDGDYVDAATAAAGGGAGAPAAAEPSASSPPTIYGSTVQGQTLTESHGTWPGSPTSYSYQWEDCNTAGARCVAVPGATGQTYVLIASDIGHTIRVVETATYPGGNGLPATSGPTSQVLSTVPLYWLYTPYGNVYPSVGTAWYGSPIAHGFRGASITGMAATSTGTGYWLVGAGGGVYAYGTATVGASPRHVHAIRGIVAAPGGGYWLWTAYGNVYRKAGTPWYGSPAAGGLRGASVTGMAATSDGGGYWLVTSTGRVFAFGDAVPRAAPRHAHPIRGVAAAPGGGYWLWTAYGNVYAKGAPWYGSASSRGFRGASVTGMAVSPSGKGYWLVTSAGAVYTFGDAAKFAPPPHGRPIIGIAGG